MNKITEICDSFKENTTGALAIVNEAGEKIYLNSSSTGMDIQNLNLKELMVQWWHCHRLATIADIQHKNAQGGKV